VDASSEIVVGLDRTGTTRIERMSCEVPMIFRSAGTSDGALHLSWVNGAASPVGGDSLMLSVTVLAGASLVVRSTGATLAHPGARGAGSQTRTSITLYDGARIDWWPEPIVPIAGCRHRATTEVAADETATGRIVESVVRGRCDELPGDLALHQRVTVGGLLVLDHEVHLGARVHASPGASGTRRAMLSALRLNCDGAPVTHVGDDRSAARFPLGVGASLLTAIGDDVRLLHDLV
jgi:urease accessory protein